LLPSLQIVVLGLQRLICTDRHQMAGGSATRVGPLLSARSKLL